MIKTNSGQDKQFFEIFLKLSIEAFNKIFDKPTPLRKRLIQEEKRFKNSSITPGILTPIKNKNKLYRKYKEAKGPCGKHIPHKEFKKYQNQLNKTLKSSKVLNYQIFLPRNFFKDFNKTLNNRLADLINFYLIKGIFSNVLKTPQVLPTFTKGYKTDTVNYGPILLISNISK